MKKHFIVVGALISSILWVVGCSLFAAPPACENVLPKIQQQGYLTLGKVDPTLLMLTIPPQVTQKEVILLKNLSKKLKVRFVTDDSYASYDKVVDAVAENKVDLGIAYLSVTEERLSKVNFSNPYMTIKRYFVFTNEGWARFKHSKNLLQTLNDPSVRVAVFEKTVYERLGKGLLPNAKLIPFRGWRAIAAKLQQGEVDCTVINELEYQDQFSGDKFSSARFVKVPLDAVFHDQIAVAVPKSSCDLLALVNKSV